LHEQERETCDMDKNDVLEELLNIAKLLYKDKKAFTSQQDTAIIDLLATDKTGKNNEKKVNNFQHRTLMEFILAKNLIDIISVKNNEKEIREMFSNSYRSDVFHFVKAYFESITEKDKIEIADNLIAAYESLDKTHKNEAHLFYTKSNILYSLTRLGVKPEGIETFMRKAYDDTTEDHIHIKQDIAYGSANLGALDIAKGIELDSKNDIANRSLFAIALDFAKDIKLNSKNDIANRSWTLAWYGDQPKEDPFSYKYDEKCDWKKSREARLVRLQSNKAKHQAFRMFDLRILFTFYESRGWKSNEINSVDYTIIKNCNTNIEGFPIEVNNFLEESKEILVKKYGIELNKHL
jgi:hypothetical protein